MAPTLARTADLSGSLPSSETRSAHVPESNADLNFDRELISTGGADRHQLRNRTGMAWSAGVHGQLGERYQWSQDQLTKTFYAVTATGRVYALNPEVDTTPREIDTRSATPSAANNVPEEVLQRSRQQGAIREISVWKEGEKALLFLGERYSHLEVAHWGGGVTKYAVTESGKVAVWDPRTRSPKMIGDEQLEALPATIGAKARINRQLQNPPRESGVVFEKINGQGDPVVVPLETLAEYSRTRLNELRREGIDLRTDGAGGWKFVVDGTPLHIPIHVKGTPEAQVDLMLLMTDRFTTPRRTFGEFKKAQDQGLEFHAVKDGEFEVRYKGLPYHTEWIARPESSLMAAWLAAHDFNERPPLVIRDPSGQKHREVVRIGQGHWNSLLTAANERGYLIVQAPANPARPDDTNYSIYRPMTRHDGTTQLYRMDPPVRVSAPKGFESFEFNRSSALSRRLAPLLQRDLMTQPGRDTDIALLMELIGSREHPPVISAQNDRDISTLLGRLGTGGISSHLHYRDNFVPILVRLSREGHPQALEALAGLTTARSESDSVKDLREKIAHEICISSPHEQQRLRGQLERMAAWTDLGPEMRRGLQAIVTAQRLGIEHPLRFSPANLSEIIANRRSAEHDTRPIAVMLMPKSDWNGAFDYTLNRRFEDLKKQGFKVMCYEIGSDRELSPALNNAVYRGSPPVFKGVSMAIIAGHGHQFGTAFEASRGGDGALDLWDEHRLRAERFGNYFTAGSQVILLSCSTGQGERWQNNVANMMRRLIPHAKEGGIFSPVQDGNIRSIDFLESDLKVIQRVQFLNKDGNDIRSYQARARDGKYVPNAVVAA